MKYIYVIGLMLFLGYARAQVIDFFPYTESFESSTTLWSGVVDNAHSCSGRENPLVRNTGTIGIEDSGPTSAIDGGYYVYSAVGDFSCRDKDFELKSPILDFSFQSSATLDFNYHMYGANIGTLRVEASIDNGASWSQDLLTSPLSGDQGNTWHSTSIDLASYIGSNNIVIRLIASSTNGPLGNIAIDNIEITTTPILGDAIYTYDEAGNRLSRTYEITTPEFHDPEVAELRSQPAKAELSPDLFKIYPNPALDFIVVEKSLELPDGVEMSLFDQSGRLINQQTLSNPVNRIDLSSQTAGVYILMIETESGVNNWKIVKN